MQALDRSARAAEGECEAAMARRAQLALRQVAVWQAAAQATAQLQASQQQTAAQAAQQSDKVADHFQACLGRMSDCMTRFNLWVEVFYSQRVGATPSSTKDGRMQLLTLLL